MRQPSETKDAIGWSPEAEAFVLAAGAFAVLLLMYWVGSIVVAGPPTRGEFPPLEERCAVGMPCVELGSPDQKEKQQ